MEARLPGAALAGEAASRAAVEPAVMKLAKVEEPAEAETAVWAEKAPRVDKVARAETPVRVDKVVRAETPVRVERPASCR